MSSSSTSRTNRRKGIKSAPRLLLRKPRGVEVATYRQALVRRARRSVRAA